MKTKSRNLIISFLVMIAMLLGVFAMTPLTASAAAYPPDPTETPAETIYVGGVALQMDQYVMNGSSTAVDGMPADDASGFAWYTPDGTLILVDYTYQGKGYEYSSGNYALIYSTGMLYVTGGGVNTLKQTQSYNMGIYSVGSLTIATTGTLAIEGDNCSCLYSNNEITFNRYLGKVDLKSTGNATAIVSYDNDGDAVDEEAIIVKGGDIYVETFYPISDLTINYGALTVSSSQYSLSEVPDIRNYDGNYTLTVSENIDGSNPSTYNQDTITTFDIGKITDYKYLRLAPPAKTVINSISVSALDLPEIGESFVYPDETALNYGGEYLAVGCWIEKYTGTEWIYLEDTEVIEHSVKYRYVLTLRPNAGYTFPEDITEDNVKINEKDSVVLMTFPDDAFTTMVEVALEFSYEAPVTDYGIKIADTDDFGATVGVLITEENYTDVLGDGTVSYDPTTKTLTLNGYIYAGAGFDEDVAGAIFIDVPEDGMTINLMGNNRIVVNSSSGTGFSMFGEGNVTVKGSGSLEMQVGMYGFMMSGDALIVDGGNITIKTTGTPSAGLAVNNFIMNSGNLKIDSVFIGIVTMSSAKEIKINGGSLEIGVLSEGNTVAYATGEMLFEAKAPDLSDYAGAFKMIASTNADGTGAGEYNEELLGSYKYIKITEIESYGIIIADKDDSGATVGVLITEENYANVLGDGTVSYDPTTNTLTLNGYKYEGDGLLYEGTKFGINVPESIGTLNIVLKGENIIDVTKTDTLARVRIPSIGVYTWETDVVFSGDGSLVISATEGGLYIIGEDGPSLEIKGGNITVNACYSIDAKYFKMSDGNLTVNATEVDGDTASSIYSYEFKMTGGNLKITSAGLGVEMWHDSHEDAPPMISGGTFEISAAMAGGAFCYYNYDEDVCVAIAPDFTNYVGAYKLTAGANADGTGATDYNASNIATYKYIKLQPVHVHDYGTAWESDEGEHWNECECGDKANKAAHTDSDTNGKCDVCGADVPVAPPSHIHDYGTAWESDEGEHWNECACGDKANKAAHTDSNNDGKCDTCEYQMTNGGGNTETPDNPDNPDNTPDNPNNTPDDPSGDEKGLGTGAIVGIVIGSVAVAGVGGFSLFWFVIKKKSWADFLAIFKKK